MYSAATVLVAWSALGTARAAEEAATPQAAAPGQKVAEFVLSDPGGREVALSDYHDKEAVLLFFMGTECPLANLYLGELARIAHDYGERLQVLGINSNAGITAEAMSAHAEEYGVAFPVLHDADARLADRLGATRTAEVVLLGRQRVVRYRGRIDDRFGYTYKRDEPRRRDLSEAIDEMLAGKEVSVPVTEPAGCLITRAREAEEAFELTYCKDIAPIIQTRCHECHRPGMIGPFSLLSYEGVKKRADMIKEVVTERRMPPWHADPRYGHFSNNRRMPQEEVDMLVSWIDAGMPYGEEADLPPVPKYTEGWGIEEPDLVFQLPEEVTIPADGVVPYLYFTVPTNFEEDVWIQAAEARPGNRAVVHHIIVTALDPTKPKEESTSAVCGMAPGDPPFILPAGVARKIPKGAELRFQMHYTPTGKEEKDRSEVGLVLYKGPLPPKGVARSHAIANNDFEIPPGAANHEVRASHTVGEDVTLLNLMPHMHLRGKDFLYRATYPDGRSEILLSIPGYDFNWQNTYRFAEPLRIPKGTRLDCIAHYDNSAGNPANPDPNQPVKWGDQTWDEMMIGFVTYLRDAERPDR